MDKQSGFLLSYIKYGDNDAILHCFTLESGYNSFFVKGLYSAKNNKKAFLTPLNELILTISSGSLLSKLKTINKIECSDNFSVETDIKKSSVFFFISDYLNQILKNEQKNETIYREIKNLYNSVKLGNYNSHYIFLIKILYNLGISPLSSNEKYLNLEKGIFQNVIDYNVIEEDISVIWKKIIEGNITYTESYRFDKKRLLESILLYYRYHFPDFYIPKSLNVISEIFD